MNIDIAQEQTVPKTTGTRLRQARERMGFTRQVVAERLCLTVSTIRSIEEDKAQSSLTPLFFRGYVRSYARLVEIPEDELLAELKNDSPVVLVPKIASMQYGSGRKRKKRDSWLIYFTWLIIAIVLGLTGVWWWQNHKAQQEEFALMVGSADRQNDEQDVSVVESDVVTIDDGSAVSLKDQDNDSISDASVVAADSRDRELSNNLRQQQMANGRPDENQRTDDNTAGIVTVVPDSVRNRQDDPVFSAQSSLPATESVIADPDALTMNFSSNCWLQVTDASGKALFNGIQQTGSRLSLTGKKPYKLVIGVPAAVQIQYQGQEVDLSRFVKAKQIARLTIPDTGPST